MKSIILLFIASITLPIFSCRNKQMGTEQQEPPIIIYKKEKDTTSREKSPVISISDTITPSMIVLCIKDSASSSERIGIKLSNIYNKKLKEVIRLNKLTVTGPKIAWYRTSSPPFYFEAGIPVNKRPSKLPKKVYIKNLNGGDAVIAHFYGPYGLTFYAYEVLKEWMKANSKQQSSPPYESYVGESYDKDGNPIDPYKVRSDIIFPYR